MLTRAAIPFAVEFVGKVTAFISYVQITSLYFNNT